MQKKPCGYEYMQAIYDVTQFIQNILRLSEILAVSIVGGSKNFIPVTDVTMWSLMETSYFFLLVKTLIPRQN